MKRMLAKARTFAQYVHNAESSRVKAPSLNASSIRQRPERRRRLQRGQRLYAPTAAGRFICIVILFAIVATII